MGRRGAEGRGEAGMRRRHQQRSGPSRPHARQKTDDLVLRFRDARKTASDPDRRAERNRDEQKAMDRYVRQLREELVLRLYPDQLDALEREVDGAADE